MFSLVQNTDSVWAGGGEASTASFATVPTSGNMLVAMISHRFGTATSDPTMSGWTRVAIAHTTTDGGNKGAAIFWRVADGMVNQATGPTSWHSIQLFDFNTDGETVTFVGAQTGHSGATAVNTFTRTVPTVTGSSSLALVQAFHRAPSTVGQSLSTAFDSGFDTNQLMVRGSDYTDREALRSWRTDVNATTDNDVTWTYGVAEEDREVAMVVAVFEASPAVAAPAGFTFTATGLQLDGSWSAVSGADSYDWEIERDDDGTWVAFDSGNTATLAFEVTTGVAYGKTYRARVRTDDGGVKSDWTAYTSASTPADELAITGTQVPAVSLSWTANTGPYDIRRDETTLIAEGLTVTTFVDTDVEAGTTYTYEVRSDGGAWSSLTSVPVVSGGGGAFFLKRVGEGWTT